MLQNAAEGKKDVRSVNAGLSCSNTELKIVGNCNITGLLNFSNYNTAACSTKPHNIIKIFIVCLPTKLQLSYKYTWSFRKLLKGIKTKSDRK